MFCTNFSLPANKTVKAKYYNVEKTDLHILKMKQNWCDITKFYQK